MITAQEIARRLGSAMTLDEIGFRLRVLRRDAGMTLEEAATASRYALCSINGWETGTRTRGLKIGVLIRLLEIYGCSPAEFFADSPRWRGEADLPLALESFHGPELPAITKVALALETIPAERAQMILAFVAAELGRRNVSLPRPPRRRATREEISPTVH